MAVEEPGDFVVLELNQLPLEEGDVLTLNEVPHVVVSRAPSRRQLVLRPGAAKDKPGQGPKAKKTESKAKGG